MESAYGLNKLDVGVVEILKELSGKKVLYDYSTVAIAAALPAFCPIGHR